MLDAARRFKKLKCCRHKICIRFIRRSKVLSVKFASFQAICQKDMKSALADFMKVYRATNDKPASRYAIVCIEGNGSAA